MHNIKIYFGSQICLYLLHQLLQILARAGEEYFVVLEGARVLQYAVLSANMIGGGWSLIIMTEPSAEAQQIKQTLTRDVLDTTPIDDKRKAWEAASRAASIPDGVTTDILNVAKVRCALHSCTDGQASQSLIVYLHGGGLVEGSVQTSREWCCRLAKTAGHSVLAIDYSLAPEHPYPVAINEVIAVCHAIVKDEQCSLMSIGGDSTGCVLALRAIMHLRDNNKPMPSSCFFLSPSLDLSFSGESIKSNSDRDLLVSHDVLAHYATLYAGTQALSSAEISPLFGDLHNLPPALVLVDESELLLDDAVRLSQGIQQTGGSVNLIISRGLWHVWPTWADFPEAQIATREIVDHIGNRLSHTLI